MNLVPLEPTFMAFLYQLIEGGSVGIPVEPAVTLSQVLNFDRVFHH